jgi:hypothetical protein
LLDKTETSKAMKWYDKESTQPSLRSTFSFLPFFSCTRTRISPRRRASIRTHTHVSFTYTSSVRPAYQNTSSGTHTHNGTMQRYTSTKSSRLSFALCPSTTPPCSRRRRCPSRSPHPPTAVPLPPPWSPCASVGCRCRRRRLLPPHCRRHRHWPRLLPRPLPPRHPPPPPHSRLCTCWKK